MQISLFFCVSSINQSVVYFGINVKPKTIFFCCLKSITSRKKSSAKAPHQARTHLGQSNKEGIIIATTWINYIVYSQKMWDILSNKFQSRAIVAQSINVSPSGVTYLAQDRIIKMPSMGVGEFRRNRVTRIWTWFMFIAQRRLQILYYLVYKYVYTIYKHFEPIYYNILTEILPPCAHIPF